MALVERRKHTRNHSDLSVAICVLESKTHLQGRVLDITSGGIAVYCPEHIEPGEAVSITYRGVMIFAEVVYCISVNGGYRAGAAVDQALATAEAELSVSEAVLELAEITQEMPLQPLTRAARA